MKRESTNHRPNDFKQSSACVLGFYPDHASSGFGVAAVEERRKVRISIFHGSHHAIAEFVTSTANGFVLDLPSKFDVASIVLYVTGNGQRNGRPVVAVPRGVVVCVKLTLEDQLGCSIRATDSS